MSNLDKKPIVSMIAVLSKEKRALGKGKDLLWKIEGDLPRFKAITSGHPIIMGRKTYESIGQPLPNRTNIVISKSGMPETPGLIITDSIEKALDIAGEKDGQEIFIIGGGQIYTQAIDRADQLYLTIVDDEPEADVFFPDYSAFKKEMKREEHAEHIPPFTYIILEK